jgi:hypothetical protein
MIAKNGVCNLKKNTFPTKWASLTFLASLANVFLTLFLPFSIFFICLIGWIMYAAFYSKKTGWQKRYLLFSSIIMTFIVFTGMSISCIFIDNSLCQKNLLLFSAFPSLIPMWGWLIAFIYEVYMKIKS